MRVLVNILRVGLGSRSLGWEDELNRITTICQEIVLLDRMFRVSLTLTRANSSLLSQSITSF